MWRIIQNSQTWNILFASTKGWCTRKLNQLKAQYPDAYVEPVNNSLTEAVFKHRLYNQA